MATPDEGIKTQLRNIETTYGRSIDELVAIVGDSGLTKHPEVVAMLKQRHGLAHGAAHRVSLVARDRLATPSTKPSKEMAAALQPVYDKLLASIKAMGKDIEEVPKKGYVSLRRRKQFAMLQPGAKWINLGLIVPGSKPQGRLESAEKWNALFTHRVRVAGVKEVNRELEAWLRAAYNAAG
jgi:predicted transport protein